MERGEDQKKWLTTKDVAEYLSLSESQVFNLVSNGILTPHKLGRWNRFLIKEIDEELMRNKEK